MAVLGQLRVSFPMNDHFPSLEACHIPYLKRVIERRRMKYCRSIHMQHGLEAVLCWLAPASINQSVVSLFQFATRVIGLYFVGSNGHMHDQGAKGSMRKAFDRAKRRVKAHWAIVWLE